MPEPDDQQLLDEFIGANSEAAFNTLVARYVNLVYSAALRFAGDPQAAQEISQAVFIILARKAAGLRQGVVLSGWLYQTARLTAANYVKHEIRRQRREQEAYMQSTLNEPEASAWEDIAPLLDEAMGKLGETDRNAVVLRFFENKTAREVATALKTSEAAAHMRVQRALEKLRHFFTKRGMVSTTAIIAGAVSANSIHAAPVGLANTLSAVAITKGAAASTSTLTLVKGALKIMAWAKVQTAVAVGVGILLVAGTTTVAVRQIERHSAGGWPAGIPNIEALISNSSKLYSLPDNILALRQSHFKSEHGSLVALQSGQRLECRMAGAGQSFSYLMASAYLISPVRVILPLDLPPERFDYLITVPAASQQEQVQRLQSVITRQLGLVGHKETIETNVLLLELAGANARGFTARTGQGASSEFKSGKMYLKGQNLSLLTGMAEYALNQPVINDTGMEGTYDFVLDEKLYAAGLSREEIEKILMDQYGMKLVSTNMPVEMLVVEKAK